MDETKRPPVIFVEDPSAWQKFQEFRKDKALPDDVRVFPGLVRYPPSFWTESEPPVLAVNSAKEFEPFPESYPVHWDRDWSKDRDPLAALKAIVVSHADGHYPSISVMNWLAKGFADWLSHNGNKDLEACLGLKTGGHTSKRLKEAARRRWTRASLNRISLLHVALGIKPESAADMVHALLLENEAFCSEGGFTFEPQSSDTLCQYWRKQKILDRNPFLHLTWTLRARMGTRNRRHVEERAVLREYPFPSWKDNRDLAHFAYWAKAHVPAGDLVNTEKLKKHDYRVR